MSNERSEEAFKVIGRLEDLTTLELKYQSVVFLGCLLSKCDLEEHEIQVKMISTNMKQLAQWLGHTEAKRGVENWKLQEIFVMSLFRPQEISTF